MSSEPSVRAAPTFQDLVRNLQEYWAAQGCLIWQPHNVEVGAGTMNPATFLHVLGPEPWNVAYVEPSIRPDDARYGQNPNRVARHHQMQVILKPDPGDPQQLYLDSLSAIGIDVHAHDIRFVEDNWESPALGAWGLGWEVWLDGLEITQFTYFQQAGSMDLDPVSVEITYGLDRILMALQDVDHFRKLRWNERASFGDLLLDYEVQTSEYYFEHADIERMIALYDLYEEEARHALTRGLTRVAHDYVLKCSHLFNVLDARGTVGVTERARYFQRMRTLARDVAASFLEERERAEYPLLDREPPWVAGRRDASEGGPSETDGPPGGARLGAAPTAPADFVLEVGAEELPPSDVTAAVDALAERVAETLDELRLPYDSIAVHGTPRRLAVIVGSLAAVQSDLEEEVVGPPERIAFQEGAPTRAAEGFARKMNVDVADLYTVERGGEQRVAAIHREAGRAAHEVLEGILERWLTGLPFARAMRWNATDASFSRPVRWLLALHGDRIVPFQFAGLTSGRTTRGPRPAGSRQCIVAAASEYRAIVDSEGVVLDASQRRAMIEHQVDRAAREAGGIAGGDDDLLDEVTQLLEQPRAVSGAFDPEYLSLPDPLLITVMRKHQRYFPVVGDDGRLRPHFITVANGTDLDVDAVRHGNEAVIRARFADAAYFWEQDRTHPLAAFVERLEDLTFQTELGSMRDKSDRLERLVQHIGASLQLDGPALAATERAAALSKADLATEMVVDFTSLQGVIGREYARRSDEPDAVAEAIFEQYLPRGAGDELPETRPGIVLALADRIDSLVGLFSVGLKPTGTQDPYALRRAALGVTRILVERDLHLDLRAAVAAAADLQPIEVEKDAQREVLDFIETRLEGQLRDEGRPADAVSAVLAVRAHDPSAAVDGVTVLARHAARDDWDRTLTAYARCARLVRGRDDVPQDVDAARLVEPPAERLHRAVESAWSSTDRADTDAVLAALAELAPAIDAFFEGVLVMAEDEAVRINRLALVGRVADFPRWVADLSKMEGF